jgi:D-3-phosphoglycerate dehydrogenase / 2-oxoglutarate reductase
MPPHAVLVNAARGDVVDEAALAAALDAGALKGAALDVFIQEPPAADHPLRGRPNVLLSPHLAGSTNEARAAMIASALGNLDRVLRGGDPTDVVNGVTGVPLRDGASGATSCVRRPST